MDKHKHNLKAVVLVVICTLVLILAVFLTRNTAARSEFLMCMLDHVAPSLVSSESIAQNLEKETGSLVYSSLSILRERKYAGAQTQAIALLESNDPYTWFNAAMYLAALGDKSSVPYLIKGLRHRAWRAHDRCVEDLHKLTGEDHPKDFAIWMEWWKNKHPESDFDFDNNLTE